MEHSIKSGYDRKLADERAALANALDEDTTFYRDHADRPDLWAHYEPKVGGGKGFTGDATLLATKPTVTPTAQPAQSTAFGDQTKLSKVERELASVKERLEAFTAYNDEAARQAVIKTLDILSPKYSAADLDGVKAQLQIEYNKHGRHASPDEVEVFVRKSHERMSKKFNLAEPHPGTPTSAVPAVKGGKTPSAPSATVPNMFEDPDGFRDWVNGRLESR